MPQYPQTVMDLFSLSDIGRRLVDPGPAYQSLQMIFGWQYITATAAEPGPLASMAVNVVNGPPLGTGNDLLVQLPFALAGRTIMIINLAASTVNVTLQYNPGVGRRDQLVAGGTSLPLAIGTLTNFLAYEPGIWVLLPTTAPPVVASAPEE